MHIGVLPSPFSLISDLWADAKFCTPPPLAIDGTPPPARMSMRNSSPMSWDPLLRPVRHHVGARPLTHGRGDRVILPADLGDYPVGAHLLRRRVAERHKVGGVEARVAAAQPELGRAGGGGVAAALVCCASYAVRHLAARLSPGAAVACSPECVLCLNPSSCAKFPPRLPFGHRAPARRGACCASHAHSCNSTARGGARNARRPCDPRRRLRFLRPFSGGVGGREPSVRPTPAVCLQALSVNANSPPAFAAEPARARTILHDLHPGPELARYSRLSIFVTLDSPLLLRARGLPAKAAGRIGGPH